MAKSFLPVLATFCLLQGVFAAPGFMHATPREKFPSLRRPRYVEDLATIVLPPVVSGLKASDEEFEDAPRQTRSVEEPAAVASEQTSSEEGLDDVPPNRLCTLVINQHIELCKFDLNETSKIYENIIHAAEINQPNKQLRTHIDRFAAFVEKNKNLELINIKDHQLIRKLNEVFQMQKEAKNLTMEYINNISNNNSLEFLRMRELVFKYAIDHSKTIFAQRYSDMMEHFEGAVKDYISSLNAEDRVKEQKLIEWYEKFSQERNIYRRVDLYSDFLDIYM